MKRRNRVPQSSPPLDLTGASDILFSLVLFLLLTQQFLPLLPLNLPPVSRREAADPTAHTLSLNASGTWSWGEVPLASADWKPSLVRLLTGIPASDTIKIMSDRAAPAGLLIEGIDFLAMQGHSQLTIVGAPGERE